MLSLWKHFVRKMTQPVYTTDNGLIALALYVYWEQAQYAGDPKLADRAYQLYLQYRDMDNNG